MSFNRMRALFLEAHAPVETAPLVGREVPLPAPAPTELLIKVRACGVCRTDLHTIEGDIRPPQLPIIPGHQIVGVVEALGSACTRFQIGDRVGVAWLRHTCGRCSYCQSDQENLCPHSEYSGFHRHGGYAEYAVVPELFAYRLPDAFSDGEVTPLLCAGIIGYRALERARCPHNGKLALFGFGSSAHITLQLARARGIAVYVATRGGPHRTLARELGATWTGDTFAMPPTLMDSAIVFAPAGEIIPSALRAIRPGGTVVAAGIHLSTIPAMTYEPHLFHEKDLRSVEANTRSDGERLLAEASAIGLRPHVTPFPLDQANEILCRLKHDGFSGTAVLVP